MATAPPRRRPTTARQRSLPAAPKPVPPKPALPPAAPRPQSAPQPRTVIIDGVTYAPSQPGSSGDLARVRAGLAITTHDRNELLERCLEQWREHTPADWPIIIVDDASAKPVDGADYRFETNVGVAAAKNKCLELLMADPRQPQHLFLADDDILPREDDWWRPYIDSSEPHLAHSWNLVKLWSDDRHIAWHASGGTLLYYTREVITDVGGMRADFSGEDGPTWGCEHVNLSDRIFNRGWTSWRYADVAGAEKLFHELDRDRARNGHKSTATPEQREHNAGPGRALWQSRVETDDAYVEYRTDANAVLTCLFTNKQAQQSGRRLKPTLEPLADLAETIRRGQLVVVHDRLENPELDTPAGPARFVKDDCRVNVFFQRWFSYWQWLREHPEIAYVWCVDGTDVTQLRDPFAGLKDGKLYLGWEPATLESSWLLDHHPERRVQEFMINNLDRQILNPGLVGGDRRTVMEFCHSMIKYFYDVQVDHAQVWQPRETAKVGAGDVPAANLIGYTRFADRLVTGSSVATLFKHFQKDNTTAMWAHK
jgi:hypothetical protein